MRILLLAGATALVFTTALAAPNPASRARSFARLPDWSGIWTAVGFDTDVNGHYPGEDDRQFGALNFAHEPPYNPTWDAQWKQRVADRGKVANKGCVIDFPAVMESPQPFVLAATPEMTVYSGGDGTFRHIFTDGRGHPRDLWPTITGHSIGHWEGDTLVVDTVARKAGPDRFMGLAAFSDQAHFVERIRKTGKDALEDRMTIEDPVAFTKPWTVTLKFKRVTYIDRLDPYYCEFDDRVDIKDGKVVIKPPEPKTQAQAQAQ